LLPLAGLTLFLLKGGVMPLKLNVGLSKKIGQPNYGSLGATCHLELELESSLLQTDADAFQQRVRQAYAACRRAIDAELAATHWRRSERLNTDRPTESATAADVGATGGETAAELPASASQLNYVRRLASRIGRAAALRIEVLAQRSYGKPLNELSREEATRLILTLRAIKAGELDFETVLEQSAA
jgi:hypothetical protein